MSMRDRCPEAGEEAKRRSTERHIAPWALYHNSRYTVRAELLAAFVHRVHTVEAGGPERHGPCVCVYAHRANLYGTQFLQGAGSP